MNKFPLGVRLLKGMKGCDGRIYGAWASGGYKKTAPDLCPAVRRARHLLCMCIYVDANGVLVHPWTKLRLPRTSCPRIAGCRERCQVLLTAFHKVPESFFYIRRMPRPHKSSRHIPSFHRHFAVPLMLFGSFASLFEASW